MCWGKATLRTCPDCRGPLIKHGFLKKERTQRYRCKRCVKTFSDAYKRQYGVFRLKPEKINQTITLLVEGTSIRASSRIVGIHRDTVLSVLKFVGTRSEELLKRKLIDLRPEHVEVDEIWTYVKRKEKKYVDPETDAGWFGDYYTFLGLDSKTKLLFLPLVGKRTEVNTTEFMNGLAKSVTGRIQITTDGYQSYRVAVKKAFGDNVDFAQYYKEYNMLKKLKNGGKKLKRFKSNLFSAAELQMSIAERQHWKDKYQAYAGDKPFFVRHGQPNPALITTSRIERANLTLRTANKRFNRASICFSKDEEYLHYSVMLFVAHYNFVKGHGTLKQKTPAMAAGIAERRWKVGDLLDRGK